MSVLFVDDEPQVLRGIERMMDVADIEWEWDCEFAESGLEALEMLSEGQFEVIVTDMRMPGMDGAELLERVSDKYPNIIRIVLSGEADQSSVLKAVGPMHQYLSKPCDPKLLKSTLHQAFTMRNTLNSPALRKAVSRLPRLPSIPEAYAKLTELIRDDNCLLEDVGELLEQDLAMTAKTLQLVNSANFGLANSVASPKQAVGILGLSVIQSLVLSTAIFDTYSGAKLPAGFSQRAESDHALKVARASQEIAFREKLGNEQASLAFTGGILHDVGKLVLAAADPNKYEQVLSVSADEDSTLIEREKRIFGADHGAVGAYLLSVWGLPQATVEIVALHDLPLVQRPSFFRAINCVSAANMICNGAEDEEVLTCVPIDRPRAAIKTWRTAIEMMG
ncbi:MAG: response regulator [Fuerstiella sp.]